MEVEGRVLVADLGDYERAVPQAQRFLKGIYDGQGGCNKAVTRSSLSSCMMQRRHDLPRVIDL